MAIRMSGLISGLDTESIVKELMAAQRTKQTKIVNKQTKLEWKQDKWKDLNAKIYKLYTDSVSKMRLEGSYKLKTATSSNQNIVTTTANSTAASGLHTLEITQLASSQYVTGKQMVGMSSSTKLIDAGITAGTVITITSGNGENTTSLTVDDKTLLSNFIDKAQKVGLNASFDTTQQRLFISSKVSGELNNFTITSSNTNLTSIGLTEINDAFFTKLPEADGTIKQDEVTLVKAKDAKIILDGAELTSTNNNFSAAGITFNLIKTTAVGENISLTVTDDKQKTYDMIKDFINSYNTLLKEMNGLYYADSAYGYEPLTDEEKDSMTDDQIDKWETKIKDSLLRRDSSLGSLINGMKSALASTVTVGEVGSEQQISFANFGIYTSSDYSEKGLLHIYGNKEDSTYINKEDKLMKALEENPDKVAEAFSKISQCLYNTMTAKMKSSSINSALTYYNDKQITKQLNAYKKEISDWEDRLQSMETRYYKQFTAMETAMQNMQSQSTALSGLLGTSTQ